MYVHWYTFKEGTRNHIRAHIYTRYSYLSVKSDIVKNVPSDLEFTYTALSLGTRGVDPSAKM